MTVHATLTVGEHIITLRAGYHAINRHLGLSHENAGAQQAAMSMMLRALPNGGYELVWRPNLRGAVPSNTMGGMWTYDWFRRSHPELFKLPAGKYHINLEPRKRQLIGEVRHET
jgi:hypothetical protein